MNRDFQKFASAHPFDQLVSVEKFAAEVQDIAAAYAALLDRTSGRVPVERRVVFRGLVRDLVTMAALGRRNVTHKVTRKDLSPKEVTKESKHDFAKAKWTKEQSRWPVVEDNFVVQFVPKLEDVPTVEEGPDGT